MFNRQNTKDLLLAVLVAYVVADVLLRYATKARQGLLASFSRVGKDDNVTIVMALGVGAGALAYMAARRSREQFESPYAKLGARIGQ